ncbi:MAG: mitochondrial 2-enoyl thioester reductase [Chrysothrix sp. TS-e1954]|nr:MAG: mitochondrial 2-enoyl thioester reductase [Chrysothrix sp. TS-e1954]
MTITSLRAAVRPSPRKLVPLVFSPPPHALKPQHTMLSQRRSVSVYGYEQSKALIFYEHGAPKDVLRLHSYSISPPHSSLVTLRMLASPINPADVNTIQGTYASLPSKTTAMSTKDPAAVPGNEGVAEVVAAGAAAFVTNAGDETSQKEVTAGGDRRKYQKGDRVLFRKPHSGTFRTHMQLESSAIFPLPISPDPDAVPLSNTQAATLSVNPATAWALLKGQSTSSSVGATLSLEDVAATAVSPGQWIAQNAANSAVGRAVIQLARAWGIKTINIIRARPDEEDKSGSGQEATRSLKEELKSLGADEVFTEDEASEKGFSQQVQRDLTGGNGIKLAFNAVGGRSALNLAKLLSSTPGARHITYGAMAKQPLTIPAGMLIFSDLKFEGFWVSRWGQANPALREAAIAEAVRLISAGKFKDAPTQAIKWSWDTKEEDLIAAVQASVAGEGFAKGKGVFAFEGT